MIMKKQCYPSDGLTAALSLALSPSSTLWISSMAFPFFEVSGSSELRKVTQSPEVHWDKAVWLFCSHRDHGVDELVSRKKKKNKTLTLVQMQSKHFSFLLSFFFPFFFFFEVQFCFLSFFIFILCFYLCPSCFQQGLEVLKTPQKVCSVDISNRDWSRKYDLWTSTPLMHYHWSWACKAWMYQTCNSSQGTAKIKESLTGISKDE